MFGKVASIRDRFDFGSKGRVVKNQKSSSILENWIGIVMLSTMLFGFTGCQTLAGLGLGSSTSNHLLDSADEISDQPSLRLQLPDELSKTPLNEYVVEISDTIFVEAIKFDATIRLPGDQIVKPDGMISLGEFGRYDAYGKTIEQIQQEVQSLISSELREQLVAAFEKEEVRLQKANALARRERESERADEDEDEDDELLEDLEAESQREQTLATQRRRALLQRIDDEIERNRISVRLVNWDSKRIYVLGEVNSPGSFNFTGNKTVLDAIIEAGGIGSKANHHSIIVSRPTPCGSCRVVAKICYDHIVQLGDTSTNYHLQPGDRVFVPSLTFMEDLKQSFCGSKSDACPRCAGEPYGCDLPQGCSSPEGCNSCQTAMPVSGANTYSIPRAVPTMNSEIFDSGAVPLPYE